MRVEHSRRQRTTRTGSASLKPHWHRALLGLFFFSWAASLQATPLERCEQMESQNQLLYQQFKASKSCKESDLTKGWTDCVFKAGKTEILLVGAIGIDTPGRMAGILGSGFWIRAVDPEDTSPGTPALDPWDGRQSTHKVESARHRLRRERSLHHAGCACVEPRRGQCAYLPYSTSPEESI